MTPEQPIYRGAGDEINNCVKVFENGISCGVRDSLRHCTFTVHFEKNALFKAKK